MTKIYTKTGDKGDTSLLGGKRVSKNCVEMRVMGEVDELSAALGVVVGLLKEKKLKLFLQDIQRDLFKIGAELASFQTSLAEKITKINNDRINQMEKMIDEFWTELPELKNFILPGGGAAGAHLHLARAVCRRAERQLVEFERNQKSKIKNQKLQIRPELLTYLNRLSDFLFASARYMNFKAGEEEIKV